ncbi:MAG: hypothetical protein ABI761_16235 [Saprospiraceae bacterium]
MKTPDEIFAQLSSSMGQRDASANIQLAKSLASEQDKSSIRILIEGLNHKNKLIQHDCLKVLYEIGPIHPDLITEYLTVFLGLLNHKDNRMQWGGMIALQSIVISVPDKMYKSLPNILNAAKKGSVITKDASIQVLINLASIKKYYAAAVDLLLEQLMISLPNQTPMYAERILPLINKSNANRFCNVLQSRIKEMEKESQRSRLEKIVIRTRNQYVESKLLH